MSVAKKLDEASVSAMIHGFLAGTKKKVTSDRKKKVQLKEAAFWKDVAKFINEAEEDFNDHEYRQDIGVEPGFSDPTELPSGEEAPQAAEKVPQQKHKTTISAQQMQRMIYKKLVELQRKDPKAYAEYEALDPHAQAVFRVKMAEKIREENNVRIARAAGEAGGKITARSNNVEKIKGQITPLVQRLVSKMAEIKKSGGKIPPEMVTFSKHFLGIDPGVGGFERFVRGEITPEMLAPIVDAAVKKGEIVKFMRHNMDAFPHDISDKAEEFANKNNIVDLGGRVRRMAYEPREYTQMLRDIMQKKGLDDAAAREFLAKNGIEDPMALKKQRRNIRAQIAQGKDVPLPTDNRPIVGREGPGTSKVADTFEQFPLDQILRMGNYMTKKPEEVERGQATRKAEPPMSLGDIMGKMPDTAEAEDGSRGSRLAQIGAEESGTLLDPADVKQAKEDWKKAQAKPRPEGDPDADAAPQFSTSASPNYKDMFKSMFDVTDGAVSHAGRKLDDFAKSRGIEGVKSTRKHPMFDKLLSHVATNYKDQETGQKPSEDTVFKLLKRLADYDAKGQFKGLKSIKTLGKGEPLTDEEIRLGFWLNQKLDLSRANAGKNKEGDLVRLPPGENKDKRNLSLKGFADNELEKVGANIPAHSAVRKADNRAAAERRAALAAQDQAEKDKPAIPRDEINKQKEADFLSRMNMFQAMTQRAQEFEDERNEITAQEEPLRRADVANIPDDLQAGLAIQLKDLKRQLDATNDPKQIKELQKQIRQYESELGIGKLKTAVTGPTPLGASGAMTGKTRPGMGPGLGGAKLADVPSPNPVKMHMGDYKPDFQQRRREPAVPTGLPARIPVASKDPATTPFDLPTGKVPVKGKFDYDLTGTQGGKLKSALPGQDSDIASRMSVAPKRPLPLQRQRGMDSKIGQLGKELTSKKDPVSRQRQGAGDFKWDRESEEQLKPKMIAAIVKDAKKSIAAAGLPLEQDIIMKLITHNFESGKYGERYNPVKDFFLSGGAKMTGGANPSNVTDSGNFSPKMTDFGAGLGGVNLTQRGERDTEQYAKEKPKHPGLSFTKTDEQPEAKKTPGEKAVKSKSTAASFPTPKKTNKERDDEQLKAKGDKKKAEEDEKRKPEMEKWQSDVAERKKKKVETKNETKRFSVAETLLCGDYETETPKKTSQWDKAKPTKQQNFEPKLSLKELFGGNDK